MTDLTLREAHRCPVVRPWARTVVRIQAIAALVLDFHYLLTGGAWWAGLGIVLLSLLALIAVD